MHCFALENVAQPLINSAPAAFRSDSTPLFKRSTIESFQSTKAAMSMSVSPVIEIPMCPTSDECFPRFSKRSAAWIMALLGIHPRIRHVPPVLSASTMIVSIPNCAALIAAT